MLPYLRSHFGNPSSGHIYGRKCHDAVEQARSRVAALIGCDPDEVIFTSGGTEANNLAILGATSAMPLKRHIITSTIEHPATAVPCAHLAQRGWTVNRAAVDNNGQVDVFRAVSLIRKDTALVTVMHANNETGVLQPIKEISQAARKMGVVVHTDAAQSVGKVNIDVDELGVDYLSIAGHKLYAPKGVGALFVRAGCPLRPLLLGAGHERGLRPGTENVASLVGLGTAAEIARSSLASESRRVRRLCDRLWSNLATDIPGLMLNGHAEDRLPNTLNIRFPNALGSTVLNGAPEIAASTGSACHESGEAPSAVLTAMGLDDKAALGSVRLSLGRATTEADVDRACEALIRSWTTQNS